MQVRAPGIFPAEAVSALGYVANWFFLVSDQSHFETIAPPATCLLYGVNTSIAAI